MAQVYGDALYNSDGYWLLAEEFLEGNAVANATAMGTLFFIPQVYGDAAYNTDGYWLLAEEFLEANSVVVSSSTADIYQSMDLNANSFVVSSSSGDLALVQPVAVSLTGLPLSITNIPITATVFMFGSSPFGMYPFGYVVGSDQLEANITTSITASPVMNTSIGVIRQSSENFLIGLLVDSNVGINIPKSETNLRFNSTASNVGFTVANSNIFLNKVQTYINTGINIPKSETNLRFNSTASNVGFTVANSNIFLNKVQTYINTGISVPNLDSNLQFNSTASNVGFTVANSNIFLDRLQTDINTGISVPNLDANLQFNSTVSNVGFTDVNSFLELTPNFLSSNTSDIQYSSIVKLLQNKTIIYPGTILFSVNFPLKWKIYMDKHYTYFAVLDY